MSTTPVDLDLDALAPKKVQIKYNDKIIEVRPLELPQYAKMLDLSEALSKLKKKNISAAEITGIYDKLRKLIDTVIPDFKGQTLNQAQMTAIFNLLVDLNMPQDKAIAELEKRGVKLTKDGGSTEKKA